MTFVENFRFIAGDHLGQKEFQQVLQTGACRRAFHLIETEAEQCSTHLLAATLDLTPLVAAEAQALLVEHGQVAETAEAAVSFLSETAGELLMPGPIMRAAASLHPLLTSQPPEASILQSKLRRKLGRTLRVC